ncbi:MAG TPA: hypothetical protein VJG83_00010 [archaeon]|nr:hypothetical protein [archaeon]
MGFSEGLTKIRLFFLNNKWLVLPFIVFFFHQIYQATFFNWDSIVYLLQGKWFCGEQIYFEWLRPPVPGAVVCLLGAQEFSFVLSTALASILYGVGILLLYKKYPGLNQFVFGSFAFLFPTILIYSSFGADLFALSFFLLALLFRNGFKKGLLFGLATLSRYNFLIYFLILLPDLLKEKKKIPLFIVGFLIVWLPWILYNWFATGSAFFSVEESLVLNVLQKSLFAPPDLWQIIASIFFIVTLFIGDFKERAKNSLNQFGVLAFLQFIFSATKESRFIAPLVIGQAMNVSGKSSEFFKKLFFAAAVILFLHAFVAFYFLGAYSVPIPSSQVLGGCSVYSDNWVYFYRQGIVALPSQGLDLEGAILNGARVVLYNTQVPQGLSEYIVADSGEYVVLGSDACEERPEKFELKVWRANP